MDNVDNREISNTFSIESTYGKPRFLGVPRDDQIREESSMEGIIHGRKISEVVHQDTKELEEAGLSWDDAVRTLKYLAIACSYQEDKQREVAEQLQKKHFGTKGYWDASEAEREEHSRDYNDTLDSMSSLPGFGSHIRALSTGARVQFHNPINDDREMGDGTSFDIVADEAPERKIIFTDGNNNFASTVNYPTLRVAESYHLLEKGNQYEMTGAQLALLHRSFNLEEFTKETAEWLEDKKKEITRGISTIPGHEEVMTFADGSKIELSIGRYGGVDLILGVEPFCRSHAEQSEGKLARINLSGEDYHHAKTIKYDGTNFVLDQRFADDSTDKPIIEGSDLDFIAQTMLKLHLHAVSNPDGMLRTHAKSISKLREKVLLVTNPPKK